MGAVPGSCQPPLRFWEMLPGQGEQLKGDRDRTICFVPPQRSPRLQAHHITTGASPPPSSTQEDLATSRPHRGLAFPQYTEEGTPSHTPLGQTQPRLEEEQRLNESYLHARSYCTLGAPPGPSPALCPQVGAPLKPKHSPQLRPYCCPTCVRSRPVLSWLTDWSPGDCRRMLWVALSPAWFQTGGATLLSAVPDVISLRLGLLMNLLSPPLCSAPWDGACEDTAGATPAEQPSPCCSLGAGSG